MSISPANNMKTLAIIGSGDLGQQIAHYAISDGHYEKVVFFDDFSVTLTPGNSSPELSVTVPVILI